MPETRRKHERIPFGKLAWFMCGGAIPHVASQDAARYLGMHPVAFRNLAVHLGIEADCAIGANKLWTQATLNTIDSLRQRPGKPRKP